MSAGSFVQSFYLSNSGEVYNVRVQPETLQLNVGGANSATATSATAEPSAIVGGSRRGIGVHCRGFRLRFTAGSPAGYKVGSTFFLPVLNPTVFDAVNKFDTGSYLGGTVQVVGKVAEQIN